MSGTSTIMPNVTRSRESCRTSLVATANNRRNEARSLLVAMLLRLRGDDEYVFETRVGALGACVDAALLEQCAQLRIGIRDVAVGEHAQPGAELRHAMHPGQGADQARRLAAVGAFDFKDIGLDA